MSRTTVAPFSELKSHVRDWRYATLSAEERRDLRRRKLGAIVREAGLYVPLYREAFRAAGVRPDDIRSVADLPRLPLLRRADLAAASEAERLSERAVAGELGSERSSGSTGRPLTVRFEQSTRRARDLRFLRALRWVGYRPGRRVLLVTERQGSAWQRRLGWARFPLEEPPERLARAIAESRPHLVYGCVTPLRLLSEWMRAAGWTPPPLAAVVTTAELLDPRTRLQLRAGLGCSVFDFYGLSEVGLVAFETPQEQGYRIAEESMVVELLPADAAPDLFRIVVTDLEARAMPFLRYDTGDLARIDESGRIRHVEGREVDCLRLPDGRRLSPYAVTRALEGVAGLGRYRVVQTDPQRVRVEASPEPGSESTAALATGVEWALRPVLGRDVELRVEAAANGSAADPRGARVVECRVGAGSGGTP